MSEANWALELPRPIVIPRLFTLRSLDDVRGFLAHVPKERRALDTWRHVERYLSAAAVDGDVANASMALRLVLVLERVPYRLGSVRKAVRGSHHRHAGV